MIDTVGQVFGRLTVISRDGSDKHRNSMWLCKCECGETITVRGHNLRQGTNSCGCLIAETQRERLRKTFGLASMRQVINNYKRNAKRSGRIWDITEEQFAELTKQDCYYCGAKPNNMAKNLYYNGNYVYNGLDRIDSNKDYTIDNVVTCCKTCNIAKHQMTSQEYKDWIKLSYDHLFKELYEIINC
jgi:hypothetical protein